MLRHACVVTLVLLVTLSFGGMTTEEAQASDHGWHNRDLLNIWEWSVPYDSWDSFRMPKTEYERYFFAVEPYQSDYEPMPGFAEINVERQSTNELVCRGYVWETGTVLPKYQYCDDLRADHFYKIEWKIANPMTHIALYGVDPIAPVQHGDPLP